jgi:hypothetical protein
MTAIIKHPKTLVVAALSALIVLASLASPASARWYGEDDDDRWRWRGSDRYYGYYYREPPVVYSHPYRYYYAPPVYYDARPGFTLHIGP